MVWGTDSRLPMSYRIETRLALIVSVLAVCAVAATAVAIRQGARTELSRARLFGTSAVQTVSADQLRSVAEGLDGRCCSPGGVAAAVALLEEDEIALVYASGSDRLLARFARSPERAPRLDLKRSADGDGVAIDADVQTDFTVRKVRLSIRGPGAPIRLSDGRAGSLYVFRLPLPEEKTRTASFLTALDQRVLQVAAIAAAIAVVLTWIAARRIFNPLRELDRAVRDVSRGKLDRRVKVSGAGEIALLEQRFNAMAEELGRQQQLRRDLASDVAHELRAPLTGLRCRIESLIDGLTTSTPAALVPVLDDLRHLGRLVDDMQDLALAEAREIRLRLAAIPVPRLIHSAVSAAALEGDARLRLDVAPGIEVYADEVRMRQVVVNLLTNADRHAPHDGWIAVRGEVEGDEVVIEVSNSGSTLDVGQIERVFDRFYRTDPARQRSTGGAGLGLAIVKSLVEAHGGRVWARSSDEGVTFGFAVPAHRSGTDGAG
jgi:signal transduction histidine kinase